MNSTNNITDNNTTITVDPATGEVKETATAAAISASKKAGKPLFFNAREWVVGKTCPNTVASRSFISNPFGGLTESYTLGDWSWAWSQIETKDMILEKNTDYRFVFWLNGGENDQNNETCLLEIMFDNDYENRYSFKLNRSFVKPERYYQGWYLFSIPFNTKDACYTKLSFIAQRAYVTFLPAADADSYADLPEDAPIAGVPQRHNIIFGEGYPRNAWWSSMVFPELKSASVDARAGLTPDVIKRDAISRVEEELGIDDMVDDIMAELEGDIDDLRQQIINQIRESFNIG